MVCLSLLEDSTDPLSRALRPPANETSVQRAMREAKEAEARRVSERIDEQIKSEKQAKSRTSKGQVNVLLLGQAESGKSTTVKVFQMLHARQGWDAERMSWRTVVHLNLVRSVNRILDALENSPETETDSRMNLLRMRLSPLRRVQRDLETHLGLAGGDEVHAAADTGVFRRSTEVSLHSRHGWAAALGLARQKINRQGKRSPAEDALEVILMSRDDIAALWGDDDVRAALEMCGLRLEDKSGFFLDDLDRIAHRDYEPTDEDVVRARLRTTGVQEYRFLLDSTGREWVFYDVAGSRSLRGVWHPYFMDVKAIIFLAPISVFDERLEGDPGINQLKDSLNLWTAVCKSKLLGKVQLILFLNKCDILERKLARGISIKQYIPTYGDRKNDMPTASRYIRKQFLEIARKNSPESEPRIVYSFMTTAIDTRAMATTLAVIRTGILQDNLQNAGFIE